MNHEVVHDPSATGYDRWSCYPCGKAVVRQPYMGQTEWNILVDRFRSEHGECSCGTVTGAHHPTCKLCPEEYR